MDEARAWPEQDAVDEWCEKHGIKCTFSQRMELKRAVTAYRVKVQDELEALKASTGWFTLTPDESERFQELIKNPPPPTESLIQAMAEFRNSKE